MSQLKYMSGFNNEHVTEAVTGAVPVGRNSPQKGPLGLFPEQNNGTAFTMSRKIVRHSTPTWVDVIFVKVLVNV